MNASAKRAAYDGFDDLADFYARKTETEEIPQMHENITAAPRENQHHSLTESVRLILTKYFPDGFRPKINLDYIRFRNYAESESVTLPPDNETVRRIIESEGTYLDGSVFIVSKELTDEIGQLISRIMDTKADVIFYSPLMNELMTVLNQNHIYSLEMFRDLLHANFSMLCYSNDSFTFSGATQDEAIL